MKETTLTFQQMTEIVNAANLAVAKGYTLKTPIGVIHGMLIRNGKLMCLAELRDEPKKYILVTHGALPPRIVAVKPVDVEIDVIYEPPAPVIEGTETALSPENKTEQQTLQTIQENLATIAQTLAKANDQVTCIHCNIQSFCPDSLLLSKKSCPSQVNR